MGFFDKLGAQLTNAGRTVSQNVKNASDSSSLNREISNHQKTIQQKYAEIGQLFYERYKDTPENEFAEQIAVITESMDAIVKLQAEIEEVKARKAELVPIPEDVPKAPAARPTAMVCTKCGNTYDTTQVFCSVCGEKLTPQYPQTTPIPQPTTTESADSAPVENPEPENSIPIPVPVEDETKEAEETIIPATAPAEEPEVREIQIPAPTKFCDNCGAENEASSGFCIQCGNALN